ncbi:MAG: FGGY family carbohydrate kinase [Terricaulis sp.]|nr:FGGY family carbohydrate kinase [Terricaulis sp.]
MSTHILAIDQGTTSTRAIVFDAAFQPVKIAQVELQQHYPQPGWVEHDAEEIWSATLAVCREAIAAVGVENIAAIGVTNQRENHHRLGPQNRRAGAQSDRLARSAHG